MLAPHYIPEASSAFTSLMSREPRQTFTSFPFEFQIKRTAKVFTIAHDDGDEDEDENEDEDEELLLLHPSPVSMANLHACKNREFILRAYHDVGNIATIAKNESL